MLGNAVVIGEDLTPNISTLPTLRHLTQIVNLPSNVVLIGAEEGSKPSMKMTTVLLGEMILFSHNERCQCFLFTWEKLGPLIVHY